MVRRSGKNGILLWCHYSQVYSYSESIICLGPIYGSNRSVLKLLEFNRNNRYHITIASLYQGLLLESIIVY